MRSGCLRTQSLRGRDADTTGVNIRQGLVLRASCNTSITDWKWQGPLNKSHPHLGVCYETDPILGNTQTISNIQ